jgi:hypothetical protein
MNPDIDQAPAASGRDPAAPALSGTLPQLAQLNVFMSDYERGTTRCSWSFSVV